MIDTMVAHELFQLINALDLIGVKSILSGIRPELATTAMQLGLSFDHIRIKSNLAQALEDDSKLSLLLMLINIKTQIKNSPRRLFFIFDDECFQNPIHLFVLFYFSLLLFKSYIFHWHRIHRFFFFKTFKQRFVLICYTLLRFISFFGVFEIDLFWRSPIVFSSFIIGEAIMCS